MKVVGYIYNKKVWPEGNDPKGSTRWLENTERADRTPRALREERSQSWREKRKAGERERERESRALSEPSPAISGGDPETRPDRPRKVHKAGPRPSQTFCGTFSGSEVPSSSTYTTTRGGPENLLDRPRKAQNADPRPFQKFCGTFSGNQSEPLESSTDTTTSGGPEFGPFSPEKLKKRTSASRQTTSPQNTNISQRLDRSWMSVCCAECFSLSATAARLAAESPRPRTHQWPRETMACAAAPADPLEQPSARRLHLRKSHLPEEWHLRKGLSSILILLIHAQ